MGIFSTYIDIFSAATLRAGGRAISSLTDGTRESQLVNSFWKLAAFEAVKDHQWNDAVASVSVAAVTPQAFAAGTGRSDTKYIELAGSAPSAGTGVIGILSHVTAPLVHVKEVIVEGVTGKFQYQVEGTKIVSAAWPAGTPGITVVYFTLPLTAGNLNTVALNDPLLNEAILLKLAQKLCYPLSGNLNTEQKLMAEYQGAIYHARQRDGLELTGEDAPNIAQMFNTGFNQQQRG